MTAKPKWGLRQVTRAT